MYAQPLFLRIRPCHNYDILTKLSTVERERKKAEKQAKFDQKKAKVAAAAPASSKSKEKKAKAEKKAEEEILPPYVEETPAGDKKSMPCILFTVPSY